MSDSNSFRDETALQKEIEETAAKSGVRDVGRCVAELLPLATHIGTWSTPPPDKGPPPPTDGRISRVIGGGKPMRTIEQAVIEFAAEETLGRSTASPSRDAQTALHMANRTGPRPGRPGYRGGYG